MAQKLVLCECNIGTDILQSHPLAEYIADGYEVKSVSGYLTRDNRHMSLVVLSEPVVAVEKVSAPMFSLSEGESSASLTMSSATVGADIYYTTDGSTPSSTATKYTEAITLSATTTVKAVAIKSDKANSDVVTFGYTAASSDAQAEE